MNPQPYNKIIIHNKEIINIWYPMCYKKYQSGFVGTNLLFVAERGL